MRIYLDTEFIEYPHTIDLISIGLVDEFGNTVYFESSEFDESRANEFVRERVLPNLVLREEDRLPLPVIRDRILEFVGESCQGGVPEFWGYYADYDWVVFCWLFGAMIDLPDGWPMYCRDLRQELDRLGTMVPEDVVPKPGSHNALDDAQWAKAAHEWLLQWESNGGGCRAI